MLRILPTTLLVFSIACSDNHPPTYTDLSDYTVSPSIPSKAPIPYDSGSLPQTDSATIEDCPVYKTTGLFTEKRDNLGRIISKCENTMYDTQKLCRWYYYKETNFQTKFHCTEGNKTSWCIFEFNGIEYVPGTTQCSAS
jgi:hypothetical protein